MPQVVEFTPDGRGDVVADCAVSAADADVEVVALLADAVFGDVVASVEHGATQHVGEDGDGLAALLLRLGMYVVGLTLALGLMALFYLALLAITGARPVSFVKNFGQSLGFALF